MNIEQTSMFQPPPPGGNYSFVPVSLKEAKVFEDEHHRHNAGAKGHKFSIGLESGGVMIGVATVGRPIARLLDDGFTAEITRVCVLDGYRNANSMLYGACVRAAKAMGYRRIITYTLETESGSSLKAAGFIFDGVVQPNKNGWDRKNRRRSNEGYPYGKKIRWIKK